jgi:hypothetical protein
MLGKERRSADESQVTTRIDALSSIFVASLATYLLYGPKSIDPSNIGFSLSMAVGFSGMILFWVRILNDLEGMFFRFSLFCFRRSF